MNNLWPSLIVSAADGIAHSNWDWVNPIAKSLRDFGPHLCDNFWARFKLSSPCTLSKVSSNIFGGIFGASSETETCTMPDGSSWNYRGNCIWAIKTKNATSSILKAEKVTNGLKVSFQAGDALAEVSADDERFSFLGKDSHSYARATCDFQTKTCDVNTGLKLFKSELPLFNQQLRFDSSSSENCHMLTMELDASKLNLQALAENGGVPPQGKSIFSLKSCLVEKPEIREATINLNLNGKGINCMGIETPHTTFDNCRSFGDGVEGYGFSQDIQNKRYIGAIETPFTDYFWGYSVKKEIPMDTMVSLPSSSSVPANKTN